MKELTAWFNRFINCAPREFTREECFLAGAITLREKAIVLMLQNPKCPPALINQIHQLGEEEYDSKAI